MRGGTEQSTTPDLLENKCAQAEYVSKRTTDLIHAGKSYPQQLVMSETYLSPRLWRWGSPFFRVCDGVKGNGRIKVLLAHFHWALSIQPLQEKAPICASHF